MSKTEKLIETKVRAFAKDINKFIDTKRAAKLTELKKKAKPGEDPDKTLVSVSFEYSGRKGSIQRSPEDQAASVSNGKSWTCASSHMIDKARHVMMRYGPPGKKKKISWDHKSAFGSNPEHFMSLSDLQSKWKTLMSAQGLKNYKGGDGWGAGDAFHFELPDSKVPKSDKRVQACLAQYAKLTRLEGKSKNNSFETGSWKKALKPHIEKAEKTAAAEKEAERVAGLKKLQFEGSAAGKQTLMKAASKSGSTAGKPFPDIDMPPPTDAGKMTSARVSCGTDVTWDSLARSIFESLGLMESKGFDVRLNCGVTFNRVTYANLSQSFITALTPVCVLIYNTPAARAMGMTAGVTSNVKLAKSGKHPTGTVVFDFTLKNPLDQEKGTITITLAGGKATAKSKLN